MAAVSMGRWLRLAGKSHSWERPTSSSAGVAPSPLLPFAAAACSATRHTISVAEGRRDTTRMGCLAVGSGRGGRAELGVCGALLARRLCCRRRRRRRCCHLRRIPHAWLAAQSLGVHLYETIV